MLLQGDVCTYSHGVYECWLHPAKYRTQLCKDGAQCRRPVCFFAHSVSELRSPTYTWDSSEVLYLVSPPFALSRPHLRWHPYHPILLPTITAHCRLLVVCLCQSIMRYVPCCLRQCTQLWHNYGHFCHVCRMLLPMASRSR